MSDPNDTMALQQIAAALLRSERFVGILQNGLFDIRVATLTAAVVGSMGEPVNVRDVLQIEASVRAAIKTK